MATEPPNDWGSVFGGPAWTRVVETDGAPGQWYLHLFDAAQPDLDWTNPEVRDGVRVDPAVLARPGRRRLPHRRRARAGQGSRDARPDGPVRRGRLVRRRPSRTGTGTRSTTSTGRGGASPTRTRASGCSSARCGCRARTGSPATCGPTSSTPRSTSTSCERRGTPAALRAAIDARIAALGAVGAPADVGAVEPRRDPPRHPLRRAVTPAVASTGPGRGAADARASPVARTSTKATSSASRRSRIFPAAARQDPDVPSQRRRSRSAATGAASRCRGRATAPPFGFGPSAGRGCPSRPVGRADGRAPGRRPRARCWRSTGRRCACGATHPALGDGIPALASAGAGGTCCLYVRHRGSPASSTWATTRWRSPPPWPPSSSCWPAIPYPPASAPRPPPSGARRRPIAGGSERREALLEADQGSQGVAVAGHALSDVGDGPAVGARSGSSSSSHAIGTDTGAPGAARVLNGATSVLLIAFWV